MNKQSIIFDLLSMIIPDQRWFGFPRFGTSSINRICLAMMAISGTGWPLLAATIPTQAYIDALPVPGQQNKCLRMAITGIAENGTNIELFDCTDLVDQRWAIDGASTFTPSKEFNRIHDIKDRNKCIDVETASTDNGANVQILSCQATESQQWYFEDNYIRFNKNRNKCLDLNQSRTDNGNNIQLFDCNGTNAQKWTYDGITQAFRSWVVPDQCLDVIHSGTADRTNIQIWDCNGTDAQKFIIE